MWHRSSYTLLNRAVQHSDGSSTGERGRRMAGLDFGLFHQPAAEGLHNRVV
jgi:hypothetical protein